MTRIALALGLTLAAGCNKNSNLNASDCGAQQCPVGTAFSEYRVDREGFELDASADPATYSGEVAFKTFGESECTYQCETINPCPENTFPVITESCFTCGVVAPDGNVSQGSCSDGTQTLAVDTGL